MVIEPLPSATYTDSDSHDSSVKISKVFTIVENALVSQSLPKVPMRKAGFFINPINKPKATALRSITPKCNQVIVGNHSQSSHQKLAMAILMLMFAKHGMPSQPSNDQLLTP